MIPNYEAATFWLDLLQWAVVIGVGIYAWIGKRDQATQRKIEEHGRRLTTQSERLVQIEAQLNHLPQDDDIKRLTAGVADVQGDVKAIVAEMQGLNKVIEIMQRQNDTIDGWLRQNASQGR